MTPSYVCTIIFRLKTDNTLIITSYKAYYLRCKGTERINSFYVLINLNTF